MTKERLQQVSDFKAKWYLSTEGYYFQYRHDRNNEKLFRATLYKEQTEEVADDVAVNCATLGIERSHHDIINYFEARLTLQNNVPGQTEIFTNEEIRKMAVMAKAFPRSYVKGTRFEEIVRTDVKYSK